MDTTTSAWQAAASSAPFPILACLREIHALYRDDFSGAVATYIPELAKVDPALFGIAMVTADGHVYEVGDAAHAFTIQSISKPFVYGLALEDHGIAPVMSKVGVEPTGEAFNSIVMDEKNNRPFNPMVNAGAIASTAMITGNGRDERSGRILSLFNRFAGRPLTIDQEVFRSEKETGHRNRAIAYLELNAGMVADPVDEHLDLYFEQCSILVTARDLAVMAATLANHGVNPLTGERAIADGYVTSMLSIMTSCGMYDYSGEWLYRVGLPAKSGVGGGILAVLPGQFGLGVFSPPLDAQGNSHRGIRVCEDLSRRFNLHVFDAFTIPGTAVRRRYTAAQTASKRQRGDGERRVLDRRGGEICVCELQGDLVFASVEQLFRKVEADVDALSYLILDGHRVGRADRTAIALLGQLKAMLDGRGVPMLLAGFSATIAAAVVAPECRFDNADAALEWCEDRLIEAEGAVAAEDGTLPLERMDILAGLPAPEIAAIAEFAEPVRFQSGEEIIREGDPADRLFLLAAGSASISLRKASGERGGRLAAFAPGVAFGELAVFNGGSRTASVIADTDVTCYALTIERLDALAVRYPELYRKLLIAVGRSLADRLRRAAAEIRALQA